MEAPLGTLIKHRTCRAAFQEKAEEDYARSILDGGTMATGGAAIPPEIVRLERQDEYRKHMLDVVRGNPELMKMVRERDALKKNYDAELKKRHEGQVVSF